MCDKIWRAEIFLGLGENRQIGFHAHLDITRCTLKVIIKLIISIKIRYLFSKSCEHQKLCHIPFQQLKLLLFWTSGKPAQTDRTYSS